MYESPIIRITEDIIKDLGKREEGYLVESVRKVGFQIDKEELEKALRHDRYQYEKGFDDGRLSAEPKWIPVKTRPMDEEEREYYLEELGWSLDDNEAVIFESPMPDDGQEVWVCSKCGNVWQDTCVIDEGIGLEENGDWLDIVAWMPFERPEPWKGEDDAETERKKWRWNDHEVACIIADLMGDACACNHNWIDAWLPKFCDFANTDACPHPGGVACWEQYLKWKGENDVETD